MEYAETIELHLELHNIGVLDAYDVSALLTIESPYVGLPVGSADFGHVPAGTTAPSSAPLVFHVTHDVPDGTGLPFEIAVSEDPGAHLLPLTVQAPHYGVAITDIDDGGGNGNGIPDPGETVLLTLYLDNAGSSPSPELTAVLGSAAGYFQPDPTPQALGVLPAGGGIELAGMSVTIAPDCPEIYTHNLRLLLTGPDFYCAPVPFVLSVGQIFADDMESEVSPWTHQPAQTGWADQWHLEQYRNHTPGGQRSWKCGGLGSATYDNLLYAALETNEFMLPAGAQLVFWHWIDAEASAAYPGYCYDGGRVELSPDGGWDWFPLTPEGGYSHLIRTGSTPGPFPAETPVWSGQAAWTQVTVDLSAYAGPVMLRWVFGSDGADVAEGWYIDDVRVGLPLPADVAEREEPIRLRPRLYPVRPNPVVLAGQAAQGAGEVRLRISVPRAAVGQVALLDAGGRLVRLLANRRFAPGEHHLAWDGRDGGGRPVEAGCYFYRLALDGSVQTCRLTVLR